MRPTEEIKLNQCRKSQTVKSLPTNGAANSLFSLIITTIKQITEREQYLRSLGLMKPKEIIVEQKTNYEITLDERRGKISVY